MCSTEALQQLPIFFQVEKSSSELSTIVQEMATLDDAHKKTAADVESTILSLETTSEQVGAPAEVTIRSW